MEDSDHSRSSSPALHPSQEEYEDGEEEENRIYEYQDYDRSIRSNSQGSYDEEPPSKRYKPCNVDRLSNLPNSLITHILSFLPVEDAVKTGLLSKHWHHTWTSSPSLLFNGSNVSPDFINTALMLYKGPIIKKLCLIHCLDPQLNLWVQSAVIKQVEELDIEIIFDRDLYRLPPSLLMCESLREFRLSVYKIGYGSSVCWKSLKKLFLKSITDLSDDMILKILDGSPMLEYLSLKYCDGFNHIIVGPGSKLRTLVVEMNPSLFYSEDDDEWLEISGPSITSLVISGSLGNKHCRLKDVSSLVQVTLRFWMSTMANSEFEDEGSSEDASSFRAKFQKRQWMLLDLLRKVNHVDKLVIGTWCTQILSICVLRKMPVVYLKCKSLEIGELRDWVSQVETLREFWNFDGVKYLKSKEKGFENSLLHHLKILRLISIGASSIRFVAEFAEFVLEHAKILEELVFKPGDSDYKQYRLSNLRESCLFPVIQKLLSYPRSSQHARVILS